MRSPLRPAYHGETLADIRQVSDFGEHSNLLPEPVWSILSHDGCEERV